jgi:hypothetical protein
MAKFLMAETIHSEKVTTARLGTAANAGGRLVDADAGKAVKLAGESRFALCSADDAIEGFVSSVSTGTYDGYSLGGVVSTGTKAVTFDGAAAIGDYVVAGAVTAAGTKLPGPVKVKVAADQEVAAAAPFKWRVVSLGTAGTGNSGTTGLIERV